MTPLDSAAVTLAAYDTTPTSTPLLPRDQSAGGLSEFLVELSVAMHKHGIYPPGHPLLGHAVRRIHDALELLLTDRAVLSIGVARRQLIIEGVASPAHHPLLSELAGKLHRHHIGALKFLRGITRAELADALGVIGMEPQLDEQPLGMRDENLDARWRCVKLFPLRFDRLQLLDDEAGADDKGASDGRAAQLWVGLARAAIAAGSSSAPSEPADDAQLDPTHVARAIDEHDHEPAYDQVIVGYLLQIVDEVRAAPEASNAGLTRRISNLMGSLQPATLQRLLEMGGDDLQRRKFVVDAAQGMSVDAVVELVQAAAVTEGQTISHSLLRMLTKLAHHATTGTGSRNTAADGEFRENIARLVRSWSLTDPNPVAYSAALERMARENHSSPSDDGSARFSCEPARVIAMALELDVHSHSVDRAIATMLRAEQYGILMDLLDDAPAMHSHAIGDVRRAILALHPLRSLLAATRPDHALVRRVAGLYGRDAVASLLDALGDSPEGVRRERLLTLLQDFGDDITPLVAGRLATAPPIIARELLALIARLTPRTVPAEVRAFLTHADPALRREAARLMLARDDTREVAMSVVVRDDDERVVTTGLIAAQDGCPPTVAARIRQRVDLGELTQSVTRTAAVRAVGHMTDTETLEWLLRRTTVTGGLWRRTRLAPTSPEMLAALNILAAQWAVEPRAGHVLQQARTSASSSVRAAALGVRATTEREIVQ